MNILFLDQYSDLGGAQQCLLDLLPAVLRRGWPARVALPGDGLLVRRLRELEIPIQPINCGPYHAGSKRAGDVVRFIRDTAQLANRLPSADLIYINGPRLLPAVALARPRIPVLFHAHSLLDRGYSIRLARWSLRTLRATVVASCRFVSTWIGDYPTRVIYNGARDCRRDRLPGAGSWRIGLLGRIAPEKGQLDFVRAARILLPELPECRFIICGAPLFSDPSYENLVRKEAEGLPFEFTGWRDDVAEVLAGLDILVVPSKAHEGSTRVILEAFSAGSVVVAYPSGGIPEIIDDGINGFLVPNPSPESLAARIRHALAPGAESIRVNARAAWQQRFTLERYQDEVCEVLEDCVRSGNRANNTAASKAPAAARLSGNG
jgi:glycosyltransferase involved in cell wall biosynthesis